VAPKTEAPRRETTTKVTAQATVLKIDYKTRVITLQNEAGEVSDMTAGPEVVRFNEIKKGDIVVVDYLESNALYVHKPEKGEKPSHEGGLDAARMEGKKLGGVVGGTERISAEVLKVDVKNRKITLKGADGNVITMNVPDEVKRLNEIKKGDHIVAERTVAVVIDVRKPVKK
jgi:Cu/Ag efflux protein CusF